MVQPFTLDVALLPKAWGGARLAPWYGQDQRDIGEAWLCADLAETSTSGAGGQAMISVVRDTASTLHDVMQRDSAALLGYPADRFPLLLKFLDAAEPLSVQVHPSAAYAATHADAHLKSEAWYVVESAPQAELLIGCDQLTDRDALAQAITDGVLADQVRRFAAVAGRCCWLPSGIVHALGAGTLVFEVQTASDTTYRLYDWATELGRTGRALHIEQGCAATDLSLRPQWNADAVHLANTPDFELRRCTAGSTPIATLFGADRDPRCTILIPLHAGASLQSDAATIALPAHHATVVGAAMQDAWTIHTSADSTVLAVRVA